MVWKGVGYYICDVQTDEGGVIRTRHSLGCEHIVGYHPEDFEQDHDLWQKIIPEEERPSVLEQLAAVLRGDQPGAIEYRVIHKDGSLRWVCNTPLIKHGTSTPLTSYSALIQDISDVMAHKQAAQDLEQRIIAMTRSMDSTDGILFEDLFNLADIQHLQDDFSNATGVASIITHTDGTPITRPSNFTHLCINIIRATEKGCANCYKSDAVLGCLRLDGPVIQPCLSGGLYDAGAGIAVGGKHIANWLIGQVRDETQTEEMIRRYAIEIGADEEQAAAAFRQVPAMSRARFEQIAQLLLNLSTQLSNSAYQIIQQARFIADRKKSESEREKLQAQLAQAQKMESVGRLAGGVAHDFNNMLGVILGYTEIALGSLDPASTLHANLLEVRKAAERSADLTRQLLAFARKQTVIPKLLDLNETVEGMLKMLRRLIGEDIELAWHPCSGLLPLMMDPSQIDQILANLCVNAKDAIRDAGRIVIETDRTSFDETFCAQHEGYLPGDYVMLVVSDDGCGMSEETVSHLFEPFFTTKEVGKGTGLGLATIYGIVKQNNGFINVYSELDMGTTFRIYLPRHMDTDQGEALAPLPAEPDCGHETILLVEDEPAILEMTATMLELLGYQVLSAASAEDALHIADTYQNPIDLLVTDVIMPNMNGRELANRIKSRHDGLKLLFMSGYTADIIAHHGVLGAHMHFIAKPFSMPDLAAAVRKALID